jgi:sugar O-acyltransferase (sialic acid O-acetyltransferase NeuD family)
VRLLVVGAGGHAKVVVDAAQAAGLTVCGVVGRDTDPADVLGVPVASDPAVFDADTFIVAVGDNTTRASMFADYLARGLSPASVVHPSAVVADGVTIGAGTLLAAGVVVNVGARIGDDAILNTGCTVDHDCEIGAHVHLGPGVNLCGAVTVGEGALLGVGACAIPGASIGEWSVVGAGSAVVAEIPARAVCGGVPARPLRSGKDGR